MSNLSEPQLVLAGLGNRFMSDDAIGLLLIESLREDWPEKVQLCLWESPDPLNIALALLEIKHPLVLSDCADMGLCPGEFQWFNERQCRWCSPSSLVSTHGIGFEEGLQLARTLGFEEELYFFGIQPERMMPGEQLGPVLSQSFDLIRMGLKAHVEQLLHHLV